jgi:hypothetical protein
MEAPNYAIREQTHPVRQPISKGVPATKVDKSHLVNLNSREGDALSICGEIVNPAWSQPLERWGFLPDACRLCKDKAGDGPAKQAESEKRKPIDWELTP